MVAKDLIDAALAKDSANHGWVRSSLSTLLDLSDGGRFCTSLSTILPPMTPGSSWKAATVVWRTMEAYSAQQKF